MENTYRKQLAEAFSIPDAKLGVVTEPSSKEIAKANRWLKKKIESVVNSAMRDEAKKKGIKIPKGVRLVLGNSSE